MSSAWRFAVTVPIGELYGEHSICVVVLVNGYTIRLDEDLPRAGTHPTPNTNVNYVGPEDPNGGEVEPPVPPVDILYGDVNGDGILNLKDLKLMRFYFSGLADIEDLDADGRDVNRDGSLTVGDVTMIQQYIAEIVEI